MSRRRFGLLRAIVAVLVGCVALSGCDFDVYKLPLPGGTDVGDDPMTVTVQFENVLDLVPQSSVKVNDVSVGTVTSVDLDGYTAEVTLELRGDTELPQNAVAEIRQTSLLGEKFVSLSAPDTGAAGEPLADGATIPLERSGKNPEVEEVLAALSLVLNGGGIEKIRTITREVNLALEGREDSVKSVLTQVSSLMSQLDANKADIVDAIESLNRLSVQAREQQPSINNALDELPSALASIDSQREDLVAMLGALDRLGVVGVRVIKRSKGVTISALRQLRPTLTQLANSGDDLVNSFNVILTYPFVDEVVGRDPQVARNLHMGDYTNLSVQLDLDLRSLETIPDLPGVPCTPLEEIPDDLPLEEILDLPNLCQDAQDAVSECANDPSPANCQGLPAAVVEVVCDSVNLPLPVLCDRSGGGGGGAGGGGLPVDPDLPVGPGLPGPGLPLPDLPLVGGDGPLNRPAAGARDRDRGPTMGQLMAAFDPALVSLLTPGMVLR